MPFNHESHLDRLKIIYEGIQGLHHLNKTDITFSKAKQLGESLKELCPDTANFKQDIAILLEYNVKNTEKEKESFIEAFKKEILYDLGIMINSLEQPPVVTSVIAPVIPPTLPQGYNGF